MPLRLRVTSPSETLVADVASIDTLVSARRQRLIIRYRLNLPGQEEWQVFMSDVPDGPVAASSDHGHFPVRVELTEICSGDAEIPVLVTTYRVENGKIVNDDSGAAIPSAEVIARTDRPEVRAAVSEVGSGRRA